MPFGLGGAKKFLTRWFASFPGCSVPPMSHPAVATQLRTSGLHAALAELNQLGPFRFSGIYAFCESGLRNICLYDREDPTVERGRGVPLAASYCGFMLAAPVPFSVVDALADDKLTGHPAKLVVRSYHGVPLIAPGSHVFGTLCCFDSTVAIAPPVLVATMAGLAPAFCEAAIGFDAAVASARSVA